MAKGKTASKTTAKAMTPTKGKSAQKNQTVSEYKPSMWFDGKQIPKGMEQCKPGDTVNIMAQAKVMRKSEGIGANDKSLTVEIQKMAVNPKK